MEEVERLILEHPGISDSEICAAFGSYGVSCAYRLYNQNIVRSWVGGFDDYGGYYCYAHVRTPVSEIPAPEGRPMTRMERADSR